MLEELRATLQPKSLLEIVPPEILQSLMQGFFFGQRAGMVLIYDDGTDTHGHRMLKRLEPLDVKSAEWRTRSQNFNPFCAKFREVPENDRACEDCDMARARAVFASTAAEIRYTCHMGLYDMTVPIMMNGLVRGVLFGGQKVPEVPESLGKIRTRLEKKSPEHFNDLYQLINENKQSNEAIEAFEASFKTFAAGVQKTVDVFFRQRQDDAEQDSLLRIAEEFSKTQADDLTSVGGGISKLLCELEELLTQSPIWLFLRRGSRYECIANSPRGAKFEKTTLSVASLILTKIEEPELIANPLETHPEIAQKLGLGRTTFTLVRSDSSLEQTESASLIAVIGTKLSDRHSKFIVASVRAMAHPTLIVLMFMRLAKQQKDFERAASYIGHHLKTPLQMVRLDIEEALMLIDPNSQVSALLKGAESQLIQGLADALRLGSASKTQSRETINLEQAVEELIEDFATLSKKRSNKIQLTCRPHEPPLVNAVPLKLRVALSNLLDNAIKYSYEGKQIEIRIRSVMTNRAGSGKFRRFTVLEIENIGVGFPDEERERLFVMGNRLYDNSSARYARPGDGIGLVQAKEYIETFGGSLEINSKVISQPSERKGGIWRVTAILFLPLV